MHIEHVFPIAIGKEKLNRDFTEEELSFINNLPIEQNRGNFLSFDKNVLDRNELSNLKSYILENIYKYLEITNPLPSDKTTDVYITQSWVSVLKNQNDFHFTHVHKNSVFSGILYIKADNTVDNISFLDKTSQWRTIQYEPKKWTIYNSPDRVFPVSTGDLLLFPSDLPHAVTPKIGNNKRISLSFNIFVKGALGSIWMNELIL